MSPITSPRFHFWKERLTDRNLGAISPSSPQLIRRLARHFDFASDNVIVELGPGDGVATRPLLASLSPAARYLAIELRHELAQMLKDLGEERLIVVEGDARLLLTSLKENHLPLADVVIASIPFTYLSKVDRAAVCQAAFAALKPGGRFIIFHQYSPLMRSYIKKAFGNVHTEYEPLNIFPCFLMEGVKK